MSNKQTVAVVGASGAQGGGVVRALLKSKKWNVRALTRKPDSDAAKALEAQGVEVVGCDVTKLEDLKRAFSGAYAVFVVTTFFDVGTDGETAYGKLVVDAAKAEHVSHFVLSSLPNSKKLSGGKRPVRHFTSKALVEEYLAASGLSYTAVQIAGYYENFASFLRPQPDQDGSFKVTLPLFKDTKWAMGSVEDLGLVVAAVLENPALYNGKTIPVAGDSLTPVQIGETLTKVWGKKVTVNEIPEAVYSKLPFPHAADMADMFGWFNDYGYFNEKADNTVDVFAGKKIAPEILTLEQWLSTKGPKPQ